MLSVLQTLDGGALLWIQENLRGLLDPIVEGYTTLGNTGLMWIVLSLAMLCWKPTRKAGVAALAAMVLGLLCTNVVLKHLVARPRPWLDVAGLVPLIQEPDPNSFPSGHTCAAFAGSIRLVAGAAQEMDEVDRAGAGGVHGPVPPVCGGPLPQRCDRRGTGRPVLRLGGLEAAAAVGGAAGI